MRLLDLEPIFYGMPYRKGESEIQPHVATIEEAHGVRFLCPLCYQANDGPVGTHGVICWGGDVSEDFKPKPGRWNLIGTGLGDLTLVGAHGRTDSVLMTSEGGCKAHFFVEQGNIRIC